MDDVCIFISSFCVLGVKFVFDDFGSGLVIFGYLCSFDVDFFKIDGDFVCNIVYDESDFVIVCFVNDFVYMCGMKMIVEWVEDVEMFYCLE